MGNYVLRYSLITLGIALIDIAYVVVTVPYGIINGGVTSFSMILSRLPITDAWPVWVWVTIVTIVLALLCALFLGKDMFVASLFSCIVGIGTFNSFTFAVPDVVYDLLFSFGRIGSNPILPVGTAMELILAAVVVGIGYYLCLSNRATAVGMDTIAMILHKRNEKIPVAYAMYAINIIVLLLGLYTYGLKCVIMGIAFAGIQAFTLNTLLKADEKKTKPHQQ